MTDDIVYSGAGLITKASRNPDGTLAFAASKAGGADLDGDQQILDPSWLDKAMGSWFETGGNLREMHGGVAAGKALTLEQRGGGDNWVSGMVVDPGSATKVELGVLQGLSVGIKGARIVKDAAAPGGRIVDGRIVEVSLVDRPCNPTCKLMLAKSDGDGNMVEAEELVVDKADGPPPAAIKDEAGLRAAIKAASTPQEKAAATAAAKKLGLSNLIPDSWGSSSSSSSSSSSAKADSPTAQEGTDMTEEATRELFKTMLAEAVEELTKAATPAVTKTETPTEKAETPDIGKALADLPEAIQNAVTKAVEPLQTGLAEVTKKVNDLPAPGGPVVTRTTEQVQKSDAAEKRDEYLRKSQDPTLRQDLRDGFAALAAQLPG